jgi:hypothetical protein
MTEMYRILGWTGWIFLTYAIVFALGYWKGERDGKRRMQEAGVTAAPQNAKAGGTAAPQSAAREEHEKQS